MPTETNKRAPRDASLTMRITTETRAALDEIAARDGSSVSRTAERLLIEAVEGGDLDARLGGRDVAAALLVMSDFAKRVIAEVGDPTQSLIARDALMAGWAELIWRAMPFTPNSPEGQVAIDAFVAASARLDEMIESITALEMSEEDQVVREWYLRARLPSGRPLMLAHSDFDRDRMSPEDTEQLIALLNDAPEIVLRKIDPAPPAVARAIQASLDAKSAYMAPRVEAMDKGRSLANAMVPPRPLLAN